MLGLLIAPPIIFHLGGWAAVFYLFGALGFFWGAWWFISYMRDSSTDMKEVETTGAKKGLSIPGTAVKLGVEDPTWEQWRNLWDSDNDGVISGAELRGRRS